MSCDRSSAEVPCFVFRFPGCVRHRNLQATQVSFQPLVSSLMGTRNVTFVTTHSPKSATQSYYLLKIQKGGKFRTVKLHGLWPSIAAYRQARDKSPSALPRCVHIAVILPHYPSSRDKDDLALVSSVPCRRHSYKVSAPQSGQSSSVSPMPQ